MVGAKSAGLSPARLARLDEVMKRRYVDGGDLPGLLTMIYRRGELAHVGMCGHMDLERGTPMREDAIFRIYSMSKPITAVALMMLVEILGGMLFHSMALLADGIHMATHAGAMLVSAGAYFYARRHVDDPRFSFGTGKIGDLAAFASAVVLASTALARHLHSCRIEREPRTWERPSDHAPVIAEFQLPA